MCYPTDLRFEKDNMIASNFSAPPLYGLWKDHKVHDDEVVGPPSRPMCGANSSFNYDLSHILHLKYGKKIGQGMFV